MRQLIRILCTAAFLGTAACSKTPEGQAPESVNAGGEAADGPYYTVEADEISHANADITAVQGTFRMVPATAATGIPSSGAGGACLAFTAKDLGFTTMAAQKCTSNAQCSNPPKLPTDNPFKYSPDPAHPEHEEARFGYCDTQNNQCWSKPITNNGGNKVCNRPTTMTPGTVNLVPNNSPPPPPAVGPINVSEWVKPGARVRVVACLNKGSPPFPPPGPPCGQVVDPNRIEVMGKPTPLHK